MTTCITASQVNVREHFHEKHKCVFYQEDTENKLHDVTPKNMGTQLRDIGLETSSEVLCISLCPRLIHYKQLLRI